ncbi:hypothetical protein BpHYR1_001336 [Brachionus plicatilis]|uniref:Uncharacterized protein n=1 Tax=Brachionus plicatilis TaxID=10195 RepID=A0A3M7T923_BRAPC|nr:hypothetical protein BpHYR1_001336 [Brachionus plicatilis]
MKVSSSLIISYYNYEEVRKRKGKESDEIVLSCTYELTRVDCNSNKLILSESPLEGIFKKRLAKPSMCNSIVDLLYLEICQLNMTPYNFVLV